MAATVTTPATVSVLGTQSTLVNNLSPQVTLWIEGTYEYGDSKLTAVGNATNQGTLRLETSTADNGLHRASSLNVAAGATLTNAASGIIEVRAGAGGYRWITGHLIHQGSISVADGGLAEFEGRLESAGGDYSGAFKVRSSDVLVTASPSVATSLSLVGEENRLLTDNLAGLTLFLESSYEYGHSYVTTTGDVTNHGTLRLETTTANDGLHYSASLNMATGATLTNAASGVINVRVGAGGNRSINGNITNQGTIRVESDLTFGNGTAQHVNQGIIALIGGNLTLAGNSFANHAGALIAGHGVFNTTGVAFTNLGTVDLTPPSVIDLLIDKDKMQFRFDTPVGMDASTVLDPANYALLSSGGDGTFGNGNDVDYSNRLSGIAFFRSTQTALFRITPQLPVDQYRLVFKGQGLRDVNGVSLFSGDFPVNRSLTVIPAFLEIELAPASDTGLSNTDRVTNDVTPTLDMFVNAAGTIFLDFDNNGTFDEQISAEGPGAYNITTPLLPEGLNPVRAKFVPVTGLPVFNDLFVTVDTIGPRVTFSAPFGPIGGAVDHIDLIFNEEIGQFLASDVTLTGPNGSVPVGNPVLLTGTTYRIPFAPQTINGSYTVKIGSDVRDRAGNKSNQDRDDLNGETTSDSYTSSFTHVDQEHINVWMNPNGGDWNDFKNWSTGIVPGLLDDVVIDQPPTVVITISSEAVEINSLQSRASLVLSHASLTVRSASSISGSLSVIDVARLIADGPESRIDLRGSVDSSSGYFVAQAGGTIIWRTGSTLNTFEDRFQAIGTGSLIDLSGTTSSSQSLGGALHRTRLLATQGAHIDLGASVYLREVEIELADRGGIRGGNLTLGLDSTLTGMGTIAANLTNQGTITTTLDSGNMTVIGDYIQGTDGLLTILIDGDIPSGRYSDFDVTGQVTLNGTLQIVRPTEFVPDLESDYLALGANKLTGQFSTVIGGVVDQSDPITPIYGSSAVILSRRFDRPALLTSTFTNQQAGQRVFFNVQQIVGTGQMGFRLYDPQGGLVFATSATPDAPDRGDFGALILEKVGNYSLQDYAPIGDTPSYQRQLSAAPAKALPLVLNRPSIETIAVSGESHSWQFQLNAGTDITLLVNDIVGAGNTLSFTLLAPDDRAVLRIEANSTTPDLETLTRYRAVSSGTYRLIVDGLGDDTSAYQFTLSGPDSPRILSHHLQSTTPNTVNSAWFHFSQPMDTSAGNFNLATELLKFQGPAGNLTATGAQWIDSQTLVISFNPQPADQPLFMALSPNILTAAGSTLDQDRDNQAGETVDDIYNADLLLDIKGPHVYLTTPSQNSAAPFDHLTFHFSEAIAASSFTLNDMTSFTGPGGIDLRSQLTSFLVGPDFVTVYFVAQTAPGAYSLRLGPQVTDVAGNLMDQNRDGVAGTAGDFYLSTINVLTGDLIIKSVANPISATYGATLNLTWQVQNLGNDPVSGQWWDYVYLSKDGQWDLGDTLVGKVFRDSTIQGTVAPLGGTYTGILNAPMPPVLPGNYHVIVRTNLLQGVSESNYNNNAMASANTAEFDLPVLNSTIPANRAASSRQAFYYQLDILPGQSGSVSIRFNTTNQSAANEIYISRDTLPTRDTYLARSSQGMSSDQWLVLPETTPGTYYIMALAAPNEKTIRSLGTATIRAEVLSAGEFDILSTDFGRGGTAGERTIEILGANLDRTVDVSLIGPQGNTIPAVRYYRPNSQTLYATFDLRTVSPGEYDVKITNDAGQTITQLDSFDVVSVPVNSVTEFVPHISAPPAFRRVFHEPRLFFPVTISWQNDSLNDIFSPEILFASNEPFVQMQEGTNSLYETSGFYIYELDPDSFVTQTTFYAEANTPGVPGLLRPGQRGSITYLISTRTVQEVGINEAVSLTALPLNLEPDAAFDWDSIKQYLYVPYFATQAEAEVVFQQFVQSVGSTNADYLRILHATYELFPSLPDDPRAARELAIQAAFDRFSVSKLTSLSGTIAESFLSVDFAPLTVTVENSTTGETFNAPVRMDGSFTFLGLAAGEYEIRVTGGAVMSSPQSHVQVIAGQQTNIRVDVIADAHVTGTVTSAVTGAAVEGATIRLASGDGQVVFQGVSGLNGTFSIQDIGPGSYQVIVSLSPYISWTTTVTVNLRTDVSVNVALTPGALINGRVSDRVTGLSLANATITARQRDGDQILVALADNSGNYQMTGLGIGDWDVYATSSGYLYSAIQTLTVTDLAEQTRNFSLTFGGEISGTVTGAGGALLAGAIVTVSANGASATAITANDGTYQLTGVPAGDLIVSVLLDGYAPLEASLAGFGAQDELTAVNWSLSPGFGVAGTLRNEQAAPLAGVVITLQALNSYSVAEMTTDTLGAFSTEHLVPAVYLLTIELPGTLPLQRAVDLRTQSVQDLDLKLQLGGTLTGRILDAQGTPLSESVSLALLNQNFEHVALTSTNELSSYALPDLPAGRYYLLVEGSSHQFAVTAAEVFAGEPNRRDLNALPGQVRGTIRNASGNPLGDVAVILRTTDTATGESITLQTLTNSQGHYQFASGPTESYTLTALQAGYAPAVQVRSAISAGTTTVDLVLTSGVSVSGVVLDQGTGLPIANAAVYLFQVGAPQAIPVVAVTDIDGTWIAQIAADTYRVVSVAQGYALHESIRAINAAQSLTLELNHSGHTVTGTVIDLVSGLPHPGAIVTILSGNIVVATATSDVNGEFVFESVAAGEYHVAIEGTSLATLAVNGDAAVTLEKGASLRIVAAPNPAQMLMQRSAEAFDAVADGSQMATAATAPAKTYSPEVVALEDALKALKKRFAMAEEKYNAATSIPWDELADLKPPTVPRIECLSDGSIRGQYEALLEDYKRLLTEKIKLLVEQSQAADLQTLYKIGANAAEGTALINIRIATVQLAIAKLFDSEIAKVLRLLAAAGLAYALETAAGKALLTKLIGQLTAKAAAYQVLLIGAIAVAFNGVGSANNSIDGWEGYSALIADLRTRHQGRIAEFNKKVAAYKEDLRKYHENLGESEADIPRPIGATETLPYRTSVSGDLLNKTIRDQLSLLTAKGFKWRLEVVNQNPGYGNGEEGGFVLFPDGKWSFTGLECGTVGIQVDLVVDCGNGDNGWFGKTSDEQRTPAFLIFNVTPLDVDLTVCEGADRPESLDECIKYTYFVIQCGSFDPNEIIGPWGVGNQNWISVDSTLNYQIGFENDPEKASVPAAVVRVNQTLDADLDPETFLLGTISFGDFVITDSVGLSSYQSRLDLRERFGIFVDVSAGIDLATGVAFWELTSIDPATGEVPFNPFLGFLPPNENGSEGQGYLGYSVRPKTGLSTGTRIDALATIYFDGNEAIDTPPFFNTLDGGAPTSTVSALPGTSFPGFTVQWSGQDDPLGSGIGTYDVYVSVDGQAFTPWLTGTSDSQAVFDTAQPGHSYSFYSVATDRVGYRESSVQSLEATTTVIAQPMELATVQGTVFHDANQNGTQDVNELGLAGWTVYLDSNSDGTLNSGERSTVTSANGGYGFDELAPGTYIIAQVLPSGWQQTTPGTFLASISTSVTVLESPVDSTDETSVSSGEPAFTWADQDLSTPEVIDIFYDYRDLETFANQITAPEIALAEQALVRWSDASGGRLNFVRNTTAPSDSIINIGKGDLAAVGLSSVARGTVGVGGGTFSHLDGQLSLTSGIVWLDAADAWDLEVGNGSPSGMFDFSTVVSQEIGHALGGTQTTNAPDGETIHLTDGTSQTLYFQSHCGCGGLPSNAIRYAGESATVSESSSDRLRDLYGTLGMALAAEGQVSIQELAVAGTHNVTVDFNDQILNLNFGNVQQGVSVESIQVVSSPKKKGPVDSVLIRFSAPISAATFSLSDLVLTRDGGPNLLNSKVKITGSGTTYTLTGLKTLAKQDGVYTLTVNAAGVTDSAGNSGIGSLARSWRPGDKLVVTNLKLNSSNTKTTPVDSIDVTFSTAIDPATLSLADFAVMQKRGPNLLTGSESLIHVSGTTYRLGGLTGLTSSKGAYSVSVNTRGLISTTGIVGSLTATAKWNFKGAATQRFALRALAGLWR